MTTPVEARTGHPYFMHDEMMAQPAAMEAALAGTASDQPDEEQRDHIARELAGTHSATESIVGPGFLAPALVGRGRVWLTGCGTAYHAALTGAHWFQHCTGDLVDVRAVQAFEFAHYSLDVPRPHDAMLALSHSGTASATIAASERGKSLGMYTVALTGQAESPVTLACDETVLTMAATTNAATYTISHLTMLSVLADLAVRTAGHLHERRDAAKTFGATVELLPELARSVLAREDAMRAICAALPPTINQIIVAGAGVNWYTALEGALKIREAAYVPASGLELEEVLHGPWASFDAQTALIVLAPSTVGGSGAANESSGEMATRSRALDCLRALSTIGLTTIAFGGEGDTELMSAAQHFFALPDCPELFSAIPATIALQLFTYWLAMERGGNPDLVRRDQPRWKAARALYTR